MTQTHLFLDLLDGIVSAPDERRVAEAALAGLRESASGEFHSVVSFDPAALAAEVFFSGQGWLPPDSPVLAAIQQRLTDHPLTQRFLIRRQPVVMTRSRVVPDAAWHRSVIYNEVDRPLGIEDMAVVYLVAPSSRVLVLTCGRDRRFSERDVVPVQRYHRVVQALLGSRAAMRGREACPADATRVNLTPREREVLHWVRLGKRDAEIAVILGISGHTVGHHLERIYHKLGVETRTGAALSRVA